MTTTFRQYNDEQQIIENLEQNGLLEELNAQDSSDENWSAEMNADQLLEALGIDNI